jgi:zinc protease
VTYLTPGTSSDDAFALQLAAEIWAGGNSSRLYQALVYQQQVASSVSCDTDLREDAGLLDFEVVVASGKSSQDALKPLLAEIDRLRSAPPSDTELTRAKNRLLTAKLKDRETNEGKAASIARAAVLEGDASRVNTDLDRLQAVTAEEVQKVVQKYVSDSNRMVLKYEAKPASEPARKGKK